MFEFKTNITKSYCNTIRQKKNLSTFFLYNNTGMVHQLNVETKVNQRIFFLNNTFKNIYFFYVTSYSLLEKRKKKRKKKGNKTKNTELSCIVGGMKNIINDNLENWKRILFSLLNSNKYAVLLLPRMKYGRLIRLG